MPLIFPSNTLSAGGYTVDNSCRFNRADDAVLTRTHGTPTLGTKFTWSGWVKRSTLGADQYFAMHWQDSSDYGYFYFRTGDDIRFFDRHTGDSDTVWISNSLFRDCSAWYHIFIKCDTTQATDTNRFKVFINGVQDTGNGITYPAQDAEMAFSKASDTDRISIGGSGDGSNHMGGYFSEVAFMDGTAYDHTDLGEFDEDSPTIWKPKDPSTLTFGDNGYYLDFEDSANLGDDESGNASDFTETNIDATDQATDTPTNNFCTGNPLAILVGAGPTFSEGNTVMTAPSGSPYDVSTVGTLGMSKGKWYWECKWTYGGAASNQTLYLGIVATDQPMATGSTMKDNTSYNNVGYNPNGGDLRKNGADVGTDYAGSVDSIFGFALDLDNGTLKIHENGTYFNSGNAVVTSITEDTYVPLLAPNGGPTNSIISANFGGCSGFTISSGNADADGYGNFEYAVPSGYYALCTKNLAEFG